MRIVGAVGGIALGLTMSQVPEFTQQYEQRLGGAVDELRVITENFDAAAKRDGLTRTQALQTYQNADNKFLADQGHDMSANFKRFTRLDTHLQALQNAGPVSRVLDFAKYYDQQIGTRALEAYNPAVPVTPTGFAFAGAGVLAGYGFLSGLFALILSPFRRRKSRV